jgi:polyisoprenoid-binding protein YceI
MHGERHQARSQAPERLEQGTDSQPDQDAAVAQHDLESTAWRLNQEHSRIEFHVPFYWGFGTVKGRFTRYAGTLDLRAVPAIELTIDATSIRTGNARRDRHLRSPDFFDVARHPYVRFESDLAKMRGAELSVRGVLSAAAGHIEIELEARVLPIDAGYEIEAEVFVMHRGLGMSWNPVGVSRPYSKLIVAGRLDPAPTPALIAPKVTVPARRSLRGPCRAGSIFVPRSCRR